jgi:hypothetical protein
MMGNNPPNPATPFPAAWMLGPNTGTFAGAATAHHDIQGNTALCDGSVQQQTTALLQQTMAQSTNAVGSFWTAMMLPQ